MTAPTPNTTVPNQVHNNPPSFPPPQQQHHHLAQCNYNICTPPTATYVADNKKKDLDKYNRLETTKVFDGNMAISNHHVVAHDINHAADANLVDHSIPFSWRHKTNVDPFDVLVTDFCLCDKKSPVCLKILKNKICIVKHVHVHIVIFLERTLSVQVCLFP